MNYLSQKKSVKLAKKVLMTLVAVMLFTAVLAPLNSVQAATPLMIYNIIVTSTSNSVTLSWQTDRPAFGRVNYGLASDNYSWAVVTNQNQKYSQQTVTIFGLNPSTQYFYRINVKDEGSEVTSLERTFTTQAFSGNNNQTAYNPNNTAGQPSSCAVNLNGQTGYLGLYYNLPNNHPDMEQAVGSWSKIARQNDWYDQKYFAFSRIDSSLKFGNNFFPVNTGLPGDPNDFAVNWRAVMYAPQSGSYAYGIISDDDSWVFIDDQLTSNLNGIHEGKSDNKTVQLAAGYHKLEIFYADRKAPGAVMNFEIDAQIKIFPLPLGCTVSDVLAYNQQLGNNTNGNNNNNGYFNGYNTGNNGNSNYLAYNGQVLGASNLDNCNCPCNGQVLGASNLNGTNANNNSVYLNGWDGKYSKFKALYRTPESPDIWAITLTNQRFYITSPASFNLYGLDWSKVRTVSQRTLEKYSVANLVKLPDNAAIYMLYQKAEKKWLKSLMPTGTVFVSYPKNYWGNVLTINNLDMAQYPAASLLKAANSAKVYLISGNAKRPIASAQVFRSQNFNWADIVTVSQAHLDSYVDGAALQ